jgi:hypothetical protein
MKTGKVQKFKSLSQFKSLKDFNNNIEMWMCDYKKEFTKSELIAFNRLKRFAAKVYGIANVSINKLSDVSKDMDGAGVSRSTIKRMLRKAKKFGIITVYDTERVDGSTSTNVYVFNCYSIEPCTQEQEVSESPVYQEEVVEQLNHHETENKSKTNNILNKRRRNVYKGIPLVFQEYLGAYYSPKQVKEFWKCVKYSTQSLPDYSTADKIHLGIDAIRFMREQIRDGYKVRKSIFSYYYGIVNGILDREFIMSEGAHLDILVG